MKKITIIISIIIISNYSNAQDSSIYFRAIKDTNFIQQANNETKLSILYFCFDGCGPCVKMKREVFVNRQVAEFYNSNFICYRINLSKDLGPFFRKKYKIEECPNFIYLDKNYRIIHKTYGFLSPKRFIEQGEIAITNRTTTKTYAYYKEKYKNGERSPEFLYNYIYYLNKSNSKEIDSTLINAYLSTQLSYFKKPKNIKMIYEFAIYQNSFFLGYNNAYFDFMQNHNDRFYQFYDTLKVDNLISVITSKQKYDKGNRDPDFLLNYINQLRDWELKIDSLLINEYLATQVNDLDKPENLRIIIEFAIHKRKIYLDFTSIYFQYLFQNKEKFYKYSDTNFVGSRILSITIDAYTHAANIQNIELLNKTLSVLKDFDNGKIYHMRFFNGGYYGYIDGVHRVLSAKAYYYEKSGNKKKYKEVENEKTRISWNNSNQLNAMAWNYYLSYSNNVVRLKYAEKWVIRSIKLNSNYNNNDTYASVLYRLGKYKKALKKAEYAILIAKDNNLKYESTENLIKKIKTKMAE